MNYHFILIKDISNILESNMGPFVNIKKNYLRRVTMYQKSERANFY